ncbi:helix-turn-helix transcriptional regulator [Streptomyces sp. WMMC500]|uniref:helix-turn-helix domain-containing protein n=1 Tax=Streptomyces sp. WMMC500 TaxID=3015154 RepID=UPI00248AF03C|nr:helix-turn-helix transcriptional regulator [Streptomyces sp. WMMC500]WBB59747.1 helix-turn-helix transcriptional regulator [Streptomyces sp. WMMC500]
MTTLENSQPPGQWRYCGNQIKRWRQRAGISREELADEAGYGLDYVKMMEQGRRRPTPRALQVADEMCDAQGLLVAALGYLQPEKFASYSHEYMVYEAEAVALSWYESRYLPGLLQTEEYIRAVLASNLPPLDAETLEERVKARLERQALLEIESRSFSFVIEEAVLRRRFSDEEAYKRQLHRLLEAAERRNVTLQVMPSDRGLHAGLRGSFVLLETPEHEHLAYEESHTSGLLYADPEKVSIVMRRHDMVTREALCPGDSLRFITRLLEER